MSEDSDVEQGQLLRLTCQDSNENIRASSQELCHHHFYTLNRFSTALAQYSTGIAIRKASENIHQLKGSQKIGLSLKLWVGGVKSPKLFSVNTMSCLYGIFDHSEQMKNKFFYGCLPLA